MSVENADECASESLGQEENELKKKPIEFEATAKQPCLADGKSSFIAGNGLSITSVCLTEQSSGEKQIELIVQQKRTLKPTLCSPPKRYILMMLGFFGMVMLYALRVNLSVAIVSMVKTKVNISSPSLAPNSSATDKTSPELIQSIQGEFDWDESTQALVLGSFFWGYVVFQLPGGRLADSIGSKWILGSGILMTSLMTIISPFASRCHYMLFVGCRILEGVFEGCVIPAMHSMIAKWMPPYERSTTATIIYSGSLIGTVVTMPIAALLCDSTFFGGWASVFYFFGLAGVVWSMLWFYFISETPQQHPTISQHELRTILTSQNHDSSKKKPSIPWKSILTSVPVWALTLTHFGQNWGFYTLLTQMPRYFKELGFDLKSNGVYSALPYLSQALVACSMGFVCDRLYRTKRFTLATLRKSFNSTAFAGTAICMFLITFIGRDRLLNIVLLVIALGVNGMSMTGFTVTHVDMSPNFSGTLMGITNTIANFAGVLVPFVVGQIMNAVVGDEATPQLTLLAWHYVFYLSAIVFAITGLIYVLFGSNQVQTWNDPPPKRQLPTSRYMKKFDSDEAT